MEHYGCNNSIFLKQKEEQVLRSSFCCGIRVRLGVARIVCFREELELEWFVKFCEVEVGSLSCFRYPGVGVQWELFFSVLESKSGFGVVFSDCSGVKVRVGKLLKDGVGVGVRVKVGKNSSDSTTLVITLYVKTLTYAFYYFFTMSNIMYPKR